MYRVVAFTDSAEVATISSRWWRPDDEDRTVGKVSWPPCRTESAKNKLLEAHTKPEPTWAVYRARTLFTHDELKKARDKERLAEVDSDLASESEKENTGPRHKRKNGRYADFVMTEDENSDLESADVDAGKRATLAKPPPSPFTTRGQHGPQTSPGPASGHYERTPSTPTTSRKGQHGPQTSPGPASGHYERTPSTPTTSRKEVRGAHRSPASVPSIPSEGGMTMPPPTPMTSSLAKDVRHIKLMMAQLLKGMEGVQAGMQQFSAKMTALEAKVAGEKRTKEGTLMTMEEFDELNLRLQDRIAYNSYVDQLSGWCSMARSDLERNIKAVMRAVLSPTLAEQLSLKGRNKKRGIEGSSIYDAICEVMRRNGGADRLTVGGCVAKWLSGSRDRNGRRLQRLKASLDARPGDDGADADADAGAAQLPSTAAATEHDQLPPTATKSAAAERTAAREGLGVAEGRDGQVHFVESDEEMELTIDEF